MDKKMLAWIVGVPVGFVVYWFCGFAIYRWLLGGTISITEAMSYVFFPLILPLLGAVIGTPIFILVIWFCQKIFYRMKETPAKRQRRKERNKRLRELKKRWKNELPKTPVPTQYGGGEYRRIRTLYTLDQFRNYNYEDRDKIGNLLLFEQIIIERCGDPRWRHHHGLEFAFLESELIEGIYISPEQYAEFEKQYREREKEEARVRMENTKKEIADMNAQKTEAEVQKKESWLRAGGRL